MNSLKLHGALIGETWSNAHSSDAKSLDHCVVLFWKIALCNSYSVLQYCNAKSFFLNNLYFSVWYGHSFIKTLLWQPQFKVCDQLKPGEGKGEQSKFAVEILKDDLFTSQSVCSQETLHRVEEVTKEHPVRLPLHLNTSRISHLPFCRILNHLKQFKVQVSTLISSEGKLLNPDVLPRCVSSGTLNYDLNTAHFNLVKEMRAIFSFW